MTNLMNCLNKYQKYVFLFLLLFMGLAILRWLVIDHYTSKFLGFFKSPAQVQEKVIADSNAQQELKAAAWIESYIKELEKMRSEVMKPLAGEIASPHQVFIQERVDEQYRAVGKEVKPQYPDALRLQSYEIVKPYAEFMDKGLNHLMQCGEKIEAEVAAELAQISELYAKLEKTKARIGDLLLRKTLTAEERAELGQLQGMINHFDQRNLIDDRDILLEKVLHREVSCRADIEKLWPSLAADKEYVREYMPLLARHNMEEYSYIIGKM